MTMNQRLPKHVQFDHEWHEGALDNIHPSMLICAVLLGVIGWAALVAIVLILLAIGRALGN